MSSGIERKNEMSKVLKQMIEEKIPHESPNGKQSRQSEKAMNMKKP